MGDVNAQDISFIERQSKCWSLHLPGPIIICIVSIQYSIYLANNNYPAPLPALFASSRYYQACQLFNPEDLLISTGNNFSSGQYSL